MPKTSATPVNLPTVAAPSTPTVAPVSPPAAVTPSTPAPTFSWGATNPFAPAQAAAAPTTTATAAAPAQSPFGVFNTVPNAANIASYGFKRGGIADLGNGKFPRKTGPINGPGTGTSDSIPAMLSDGECVFTAKAVRNAGGGSRREGARRMYALMKALEKQAHG
jgi:hypothetical protein